MTPSQFLESAIILVAAGYQLLALAAVVRHWKRPRPGIPPSSPGVSILKPVAGADNGFVQAIRTHSNIAFPGEFEVLFGIREPQSIAGTRVTNLIEQTRRENPMASFCAYFCPTLAPNAKVGTLEDLAREARFPILVVNDSDISVPPDYLDRLAPRLAADPSLGMLTCLYRATASTPAATFEALGIATDFAPSAMVAPLVGISEFGLGSTLAFRAETLERIGGFAAVRDYIADDYQIGKRIHDLGLRVELADFAVSTHLEGNWSDVWAHQVRWARTIRLSRGAYMGIPVTNATFWALVLGLAFGAWPAAAVVLTLRLIVGWLAGAVVLDDPITRRYWWLMPFRDLFGLAVWVAGATGRDVIWRGRRLRLSPEGRIE